MDAPGSQTLRDLDTKPNVNRFVSAVSALRKRHLFQIAVVYIGIAWFFLEVADFVVGNYDFSRKVIDVGVLLAILGFPAALVLGWFHGERGHQEAQRFELWILATLGVLAAVGTYRIASGEEPVDRVSSAREDRAAAPAGSSGSVLPAVEPATDLGARSVAVFPFESHVADPELEWLGSGLADLLTTNFARVPDLRVVARQRLFHLLREAGQEEGKEIPQSIATNIAARSGAHHMVWGSVVGTAGDLAIDAQLVELESGTVLAAERVRGGDVFALVDTLSTRLSRRVMGDRPAPPAGVRVAGADLGTRDVGAYGAFAEGLRLERLGRSDEAKRAFERAARRDSSFVLARVLAEVTKSAVTGERAGGMDPEEAASLGRDAAARGVLSAEQGRLVVLESLKGLRGMRGQGYAGLDVDSLAAHIDSVLATLSSTRLFLPPPGEHPGVRRPPDQPPPDPSSDNPSDAGRTGAGGRGRGG